MWVIDASCSTAAHPLQGPPGTGKTHTIVAIASAVLFGKAGGAADAARAAPSNGATARTASNRHGKVPPPPQHCRLLVCAQSNAAVDELVSRLAQQVFTARSCSRLLSQATSRHTGFTAGEVDVLLKPGRQGARCAFLLQRGSMWHIAE